MSDTLLDVTDLCAFYGPLQVLFGVSLKIERGDLITLVGRNGAGRSTLAKAIVGRAHRSGSVKWMGEDVSRLEPYQIARRGIAYVPETREIFANLTVHENLLMGEQAKVSEGRFSWTIHQSYDLFPRLAERRNTPGGALSGGEQQMLALARALVGRPSLLVVDEPTEGLSLQMVKLVAETLAMLRASGLAILLVEQKLDIGLKLASRALVVGRGQIVYEGTPGELAANEEIRRTWIEV
jgi:branched-chain amino acid transport system ATP-binding protein